MNWDPDKYKDDGGIRARDPTTEDLSHMGKGKAGIHYHLREATGDKRTKVFHPLCVLCHQPFKAYRENAMYCPSCQPLAKARRKEEARQRRREVGLPVT